MANWQNRIKIANKRYEDWETRFQCERLERYYENFQDCYQEGRLDYALNMVFSTIQGKLASTVLQNPSFLITPLPATDQYNLEAAGKSADDKQAIINTVVALPAAGFVGATKLAGLDSFFRFGIVEVIYASDSKAERDLTKRAEKSEEEKLADTDASTLLAGGDPLAPTASTLAGLESNSALEAQDSENPENPESPQESEAERAVNQAVSEGIYFNQIPAKQFRIATNSQCETEQCTWCGYYFFVPADVLLKTPGIRLTSEQREWLRTKASEIEELVSTDEKYTRDGQDGTGVKVWKIFDNVKHEKLLFLDDHLDRPILKARYERLPFSDFRPISRPPKHNCWYPIPPAWFWIQQQDEINAGRQLIHLYRRRFTRKFYSEGNISPEELEKFTSEADCEVIIVPPGGRVQPIPNPDLGSSITFDAITSKDDFNTVAGVSVARQSDRTTATQARINASREAIRESAEQIDFKQFLCGLATTALHEILSRYVNPVLVRRSDTDYGQVSPIELAEDGYDFLVKVNVQDESPAVLQEELNKFVSFMGLLQNFPMLAKDPDLIFEAAYKVGYRNRQAIEKLQKVALMQMMGEAAALSQAQGGADATSGASNLAKNTLNSQSSNAIGSMAAAMQGSGGLEL